MHAHTVEDARSLRVLLAEDDDTMRHLLATLLRRDGHEVVEVCDGRELAARIGDGPEGAHAYDLIISDVLMPGANGISVLSHLAGDPLSPPVVVMTAFGDQEVHDWARSIGAIATFHKPFDSDDLRTLIFNLPRRTARIS